MTPCDHERLNKIFFIYSDSLCLLLIVECSLDWMYVVNPDYSKKTKRNADRAQRVCGRHRSVHRAEGSNGSSSHSARGQDLFNWLSPVSLTADNDAERLLRARTNMFRQRVAPRMRMRTCNALRNTYTCTRGATRTVKPSFCY